MSENSPIYPYYKNIDRINTLKNTKGKVEFYNYTISDSISGSQVWKFFCINDDSANNFSGSNLDIVVENSTFIAGRSASLRTMVKDMGYVRLHSKNNYFPQVGLLFTSQQELFSSILRYPVQSSYFTKQMD